MRASSNCKSADRIARPLVGVFYLHWWERFSIGQDRGSLRRSVWNAQVTSLHLVTIGCEGSGQCKLFAGSHHPEAMRVIARELNVSMADSGDLPSLAGSESRLTQSGSNGLKNPRRGA